MTVPTIYFAGSEDVDFAFTGTVSVVTNNGWNRGSWSRGALAVTGSTADPPANFIQTPTLSTFSECWVHGVVGSNALGNGSTNNCSLLRLLDAGVARICVRGGSGSDQLTIDSRNAAGSFTNLATTATGVLPIGGLANWQLDFHVVWAGSTLVTSGAQTDFSFTNTSPPLINRSAGDFVSDGFAAQDIITVSGSAHNDGVYNVAGVTSTTLTLVQNESLVAEPSGNSITIFTSGSATLYVNGAQVAQFVGNVLTDSSTTLNNALFGASWTSQPSYWSEVIISSGRTINQGLWSMVPQAAGTSQDWTGIASPLVNNINELTILDTQFLQSSMDNDLTLWTCPTSPPSGQWAVEAVIQSARVATGGGGAGTFAVSVYSNSSSSNGSTLTPGGAFANYGNQIWSLNPNTSAQWTLSDITSGFNAGITSLV